MQIRAGSMHLQASSITYIVVKFELSETHSTPAGNLSAAQSRAGSAARVEVRGAWQLHGTPPMPASFPDYYASLLHA